MDELYTGDIAMSMRIYYKILGPVQDRSDCMGGGGGNEDDAPS